jgi:predicted phage terminase large subunit-like protein
VDIPGCSALIVRKTLKTLEHANGLVEVAKEWLGGTDAVWRDSHATWRFPSGATLTFRHLQDELGFQGAEYQYIGVDELTELEEDLYRFLFSRLRAKTGFPIPVRMRATATPYGPGADWVYRRFVGKGSTSERAFVRSLPDDNPYLDLARYDRALAQMPEVVRAQLRDGRWDLRPAGWVFRRDWFDGRFVDESSLPGSLRLCRFWDIASTVATRGIDPDHTVGVLVGRDRDGICYVIDVVQERRTPLGIQKLIAATAAADRDRSDRRGWPRPTIRMEQEPGASGVSVIDSYRRQVLAAYDFAGVRSVEAKESRAMPVSVRAEQGQVLIVRAPWNGEFVDELCSFPQGAHDDQVDALAGAYAVLTGDSRGHARVRRANLG